MYRTVKIFQVKRICQHHHGR